MLVSRAAERDGGQERRAREARSIVHAVMNNNCEDQGPRNARPGGVSSVIAAQAVAAAETRVSAGSVVRRDTPERAALVRILNLECDDRRSYYPPEDGIAYRVPGARSPALLLRRSSPESMCPQAAKP
jgi:hypothetical protein